MPQDAPGLYLILPADFDPASGLAPLADALDGGHVEAVLLWLASGDDAAWRAAASAVLPLLHGRGIPLIVGGDQRRAAGLQVDGLHVEARPEEIKAACAANRPRRMVGAGGVANRHNAMLAGESGADYVFFGSANPSRPQPLGPERILELAEWWGELFQVPCVAPAATVEEAEDLAAAGADFIAVRDLVWAAAEGPRAALAALARGLAAAAEPAGVP